MVPDPHVTFMTRVYCWFGGRKMFLGFFGVAVLSIGVAKIPGATFEVWAMYVVLVLGFTKGAMAWDDKNKYTATTEPFEGVQQDDAP